MIYEKIVEGIFISRPNRFIAYVEIDGIEEKVHVKNTSRCKELLITGASVILEDCSDIPTRKTKYSIIAVYKGDTLINMDSQVPNYVVEEALIGNKIKAFEDLDLIKREKNFKKSRFDIYYEKDARKGFIEIKGVTLENDGIAMFPDAPTERGAKHILELIEAVKEGYEANILFLIQMDKVKSFTPNSKMDENFSKALSLAYKSGVNILVYDCINTKNSTILNKPIPFEL